MSGEGLVAVPVQPAAPASGARRSASRWVRVHRLLRAAPRRVFEAWTSPTELARWFPREVEGTLQPGTRTTLRWPDQSIWWEVIRLVPDREVSFRWPWLPDDAWRTVVTVRFQRERAGTLVSLEDGPFDTADPRLLDAYAEAAAGWAEALAQLAGYLDFAVDLRAG